MENFMTSVSNVFNSIIENLVSFLEWLGKQKNTKNNQNNQNNQVQTQQVNQNNAEQTQQVQQIQATPTPTQNVSQPVAQQQVQPEIEQTKITDNQG